MSAKPVDVSPMSRNVWKPVEVVDDQGKIEILDSAQLAERLRLNESWVRSRVQSRVAAEDRIPHARFGRYVRFLWNSKELNTWLAGRTKR
jgi:hypothetical protein